MKDPLRHYTTSILISPAEQPENGFRIEWRAPERVLRFSFVYTQNAEPQIETFDYPVRDADSLRALIHGAAPSLTSLIAAMASDLAMPIS